MKIEQSKGVEGGVEVGSEKARTARSKRMRSKWASGSGGPITEQDTAGGRLL